MEPDYLSAIHIAPCGMNCALCIGFQREKRKCEGCNLDDDNKPKYCRICSVVTCSKRKGDLCFDCEDLPCRRIKQLDGRYTSKYHMSMMENLEFIRVNGMGEFLERERERWTCEGCGNLISVHRNECPSCGKKIIWEEHSKTRGGI